MKFSGRPRTSAFAIALLGISGGAAAFLLSSLSFRMPSALTQTSSGDSSSTSFKLESTIGQAVSGNVASDHFKIKAGYFRKTKLPEVVTTQTIDPTIDNTLSIDLPSGQAIVQIPAGSFTEAVTITMRPPTSMADAVSNAGALTGTLIGLEITASPSLQPQKPVTLIFPYHSEFLQGAVEDQLRVAYFVPADNKWAPIDSSVDKTQLKVTGHTTHFTIFRVVGMAPAVGIGNAFVYPNPLRPALGHTLMNITNLQAGVSLKIFTLNGELIRQLTSDVTGRASWDGTNDKGEKVVSGVYLGLLQNNGEKKVLKLAVER